MSAVTQAGQRPDTWEAASLAWHNLAWGRPDWLPVLSRPLPVLDEVRELHEPAARAFVAAQSRGRAVVERQASAADRAREEALAIARGSTPAAGAPALSEVQMRAELQVAREAEAQAVLALCDAAALAVDRLALDTAGAGEIEDRLTEAAYAPYRDEAMLADRQALSQLALGLVRHPEVVELEVDGARKAARAFLDRAAGS